MIINGWEVRYEQEGEQYDDYSFEYILGLYVNFWGTAINLFGFFHIRTV